jgi:hypothetical protein
LSSSTLERPEADEPELVLKRGVEAQVEQQVLEAQAERRDAAARPGCGTVPELLRIDRVRIERRCDVPVDLDGSNPALREAREMVGCRHVLVDRERLIGSVSARVHRVHRPRQMLRTNQDVEIAHLTEAGIPVHLACQMCAFERHDRCALGGKSPRDLPELRKKAEVSHRRLARRQLEGLGDPGRQALFEAASPEPAIEQRANTLGCSQVQQFIPDVTPGLGQGIGVEATRVAMEAGQQELARLALDHATRSAAARRGLV